MHYALGIKFTTNNMKCIDFTLEITNGCNFNCSGCNIDKEGNSWPTEAEFKKIISLMDDFITNGFNPINLTIGPTDILTSVNREKVLCDPYIKEIASKFPKVTINCAFLDPFAENYKLLGMQLNQLLAGSTVSFAVPFEVAHISNAEYLNRIVKRGQIVLENMPDVVYNKTNLLVNYDETRIYDKINSKHLSEELILDLYNRNITRNFDSVNIVLPITRSDLRNPENSKIFLESVLNLKKVFVSARELYGDQIIISEGNTTEGTDWDIFYKAGKLYMTPFILEGIASFDNIFLIDTEWTAEAIYNYYNTQMVNQLNFSESIEDCNNCVHAALCADRGIHNLMMITNASQCISPAKELTKYIMSN